MDTPQGFRFADNRCLMDPISTDAYSVILFYVFSSHFVIFTILEL